MANSIFKKLDKNKSKCIDYSCNIIYYIEFLIGAGNIEIIIS